MKVVRSTINTLWTGDADLRLYIKTVQDRLCKSAFFKSRLVSTHYTLNYAKIVSEFVRNFQRNTV
jgi:hypothetical protein